MVRLVRLLDLSRHTVFFFLILILIFNFPPFASAAAINIGGGEYRRAQTYQKG